MLFWKEIPQADYRFSYAFRAAGLVAAVRTNDEAFDHDLRRVFLDPASADCPPAVLYTVYIERRLTASRRHIVFRDQQAICITAFLPSLLPALEGDLLRLLQLREKECLFADGGAVAAGETALLVLGGEPAARSRLLYQLVRQGGSYLSDRMTLLRREDLRVLPLAKAIAGERMKHPLVTRVRQGMTFRGSQRKIVRYLAPPRRCRSAPGVAWPVGTLFFLESEKCAAPQILPLSRADAWARLVEATAGPLSQAAWEAADSRSLPEDAGAALSAGLLEPEGPERLDALGRMAGSCRAFSVRPAGAKETAAVLLRTACGNQTPASGKA